MNVMTIMGSPRRDGNTALVLNWVEEELVAQGHVVDRVDLADHTVEGCRECFTCQDVRDAPGCDLNDDAPALFERMLEADAMLLASPLFCWSFPAQLKALLDRGICMVKGYGSDDPQFLLEGKRIGLLVTAGGPDEGNADLIVETYRRYAEYARCRAMANLVVPYCTVPEDIDPEVRRHAVELAHELTAL